MSTAVVAVEQFGGMRLDVESLELGALGAEDARNVRLRERGRLAPRPALATIGNAVPFGTTVWGMAALGDILATAQSGPGGGIRSTNIVSGSQIANVAHTGGGDAGVVRYGGGGVSAIYGVIGTGPTLPSAGKLYKVTDTGAITSVDLPATILNSARIGKIAYLPDSNRLVVADAVIGTTNAVWFFDPESDSVVGATNFVRLQPGVDRIRDMIVWERQLVVSKDRQLFFFGPPSVDSGGQPVFDYRVLELGETTDGNHRICAGRDGLYIASGRGLYMTRGGAPGLVSKAVQPLFDGFELGAKVPLVGGVTSVKSVVAHEDYIYVGCEAATSFTLLYDERNGDWTYDDYYTRAGVATTQLDDCLVVATSGVVGSDTVLQTLSSLNAGAAPAANYRSGWYEPRGGAQTTVRRTVLGGAGSVTLKQGVDGGGLDAGSVVALGTVAAPVRRARNFAKRGRKYQFEVAGSGTWSVNRLEHHVKNARQPSVETP